MSWSLQNSASCLSGIRTIVGPRQTRDEYAILDQITPHQVLAIDKVHLNKNNCIIVFVISTSLNVQEISPWLGGKVFAISKSFSISKVPTLRPSTSKQDRPLALHKNLS